jgi:hypothetical protein
MANDHVPTKCYFGACYPFLGRIHVMCSTLCNTLREAIRWGWCLQQLLPPMNLVIIGDGKHHWVCQTIFRLRSNSTWTLWLRAAMSRGSNKWSVLAEDVQAPSWQKDIQGTKFQKDIHQKYAFIMISHLWWQVPEVTKSFAHGPTASFCVNFRASVNCKRKIDLELGLTSCKP